VFAIDGKVDEGDLYNAEGIEKMLPRPIAAESSPI
jgi:hypothetical protein